MNHHDEQLRHAFDRVRFGSEPPMASTSADDLHRAERHLRRRRTTVLGSSVTGLAAVAAGAALALPALPGTGSSPPTDIGVASSGDGVSAGQDDPAKAELPFPQTRQLLLDAAVEHFDPAGNHLPGHSSNAPNGGSVQDGRLEGNLHVGTKLGWTIPGESGEGLVSVHVTTPGYASWEPYAVEGFALEVGCDISGGTCRQETIPGTNQQAWVADADPQQNLKLSVVYERDDGSLIAVGVYDLFGQNSADPVSDINITRDDVFTFTTDADVQFDPAEAASGLDIAPNGPNGPDDPDWR